MLLIIVIVLFAVAMICMGVATEMLFTGEIHDGAVFAAFAVVALLGWLAYKGTLWLGGLMNKLVDFIQKPDS